MYKNLLWSLLLLLGTALKAQVSMTIQVPPEGIIQKPQLWNFLVVNTATDQAQIKISMTMTDVQTNDPVLTATSNAVYVNNGATALLAADLSPIQYEYLSPLVTDVDPNGFLPIGQYQVCYTLYVFGHISFEEASQECISVFVEPISPPMLTLPFDGSEEEISTPQFSWLPPAPLNMFNNLSYDFKLVEVTQGQTAAEAIQQNMPVYTASNLSDIFLNYPSSQSGLDTGKTYAWQVFANNNNAYAGQSEVWTFKVKPDSLLPVNLNKSPFVKLKLQSDASLGIFNGTAKFYYNNEAIDSTVTYNISSLENADIGAIVKTGTLILKPGENYLEIPLDGDNRLINEKMYLLELQNTRNERWMLKFLYHQEQ